MTIRMRRETEASQGTLRALIKASENLWQRKFPQTPKALNASEGSLLSAIAQKYLSTLANMELSMLASVTITMLLKYALYQKGKIIKEKILKCPVMLAFVKASESSWGSSMTQLEKLNGVPLDLSIV